MRISRTSVSAAGNGPWVPVDYMQATFNVGVTVVPSSAATGVSCSVQYTVDDPSTERGISWTQSGTTVTVTDPPWSANPNQPLIPHGLSVGDSVILQATGGGLSSGFLSVDGTYAVASIVNANQYTVTVTPSQTVSTPAAGLVSHARVFTTTAIPAATAARLSGNIIQPCCAVRLAVATLTAGTIDLTVIQGTS